MEKGDDCHDSEGTRFDVGKWRSTRVFLACSGSIVLATLIVLRSFGEVFTVRISTLSGIHRFREGFQGGMLLTEEAVESNSYNWSNI